MGDLNFKIEFVEMVNENRTYLIIKNEDDNSKVVLTGTEAIEFGMELNTVLGNLFSRIEKA